MRQLLKKRLQDERGLTLIELLAVVVILGIIAAIAIPSIGGLIQNTREDALKSDAVQVINAAKTYAASNGLNANGGATIKATELGSYVDEVDLIATGADMYKVDVTTAAGKTTYKLSGKGQAGSKDIEFVEATISDINSDAAGKVVVTPRP